MKKIKIEKKFYTKIAALILGLIIWVIIIAVEDAEFSVKLNDVPVQLSGETILEDKNLIVSNKGELDDASIAVRGKRSDVINYVDDIYATADVSKITEPGEYNVKVSYDSSTNTLYFTEKKTSTIKVIVEKLQKKEVEVLALQKGEPEDTAKIIESTPKTKKITVRGTAADIEGIAYAAATVDVTGMLVDSKQVLTLTPIDAQKKPMSFKNSIFMSKEETEVINSVYNKITVPIKIEVSGDANNAFIVESQSLSKVDVGVTDGIKIDELTAMVKYSAERGNEYTVELEKKDGVYIPRDASRVDVKLKVVPRVTKKLTVPLAYRIETGRKVNLPEVVMIDVTGAEQEITEANITAMVELDGLGAGTHTIPVKLKLKKTSLSVGKTPEITVVLE